MVNQAIYNRALSPVEIQELFQYGKAQTYVNNLWQKKLLVHDVDGDGVIEPLDLLWSSIACSRPARVRCRLPAETIHLRTWTLPETAASNRSMR